MNRFLLDTNMLLGFTVGAPWAQWANEQFSFDDLDTMIFTSIVCRGEILALAEKRGWGSRKRIKLDDVLSKNSPHSTSIASPS